jgi:hypothetical protein
MKWPFQLAFVLFVFAILTQECLGQARPSKYDPAPDPRPAGRPNNFMDFTLGRINPENKDYGQCLSDWRAVLLDQTIKSGYFWSNVVALGLVICFLVVIIQQQKVLARREWSTAEILTQFEQALARCQSQLTLASLKNRELAEMVEAARESSVRHVPLSVQSVTPAAASSAKSRSVADKAVTSEPVRSSSVKTEDSHETTGTNTVQPANQMRLFSPDADLILKVNSLEQQLAHSQRDNHALRRRIANEGGRQASGRQSSRQAKEA